MMFFKLAYYDLKNALLQEWKKLLIVPFGFFVICFTFYLSYVHNASSQNAVGTFGDFWLYIFGGMKEYAPSPTESFKFPVIWTIVMLYLFYITLYYPYNDLLGYGQNVLTRSRGRHSWWLSKCLWNAVMVLLFFCLGAAVVVLFCVVTGRPLSLEISQYMYTGVFKLQGEGAFFGRVEDVVAYPSYITGALIGMPLLTAVAISELQMLLSLWLRPIFSFGVTVAVLLSSAYYIKPFMIGNYAMSVRCAAVLKNGVSPLTGIIVLTALIVLCLVAGDISFRHYDIINKEN